MKRSYDKSAHDRNIGQIKRMAWAVVLLLLITSAGIFYVNSMAFFSFQDIKDTSEQYRRTVELKGYRLNQLKGHFGYGGFIHHFKNYVLRQDGALLPAIRQNLRSLDEDISFYESVGVNASEQEALADVRHVVAAYAEKVTLAEKLVGNGMSPGEVDALVRVDDSPAFSAFSILEEKWKNDRKTEAEKEAKVHAMGSTASQASLLILPVFLAVTIGLIAFIAKLVKEINVSAVRLRAVLHKVADGIVTTDKHGTIEAFNLAAENIFGYTAEEVIGKTVEMLMPEAYRSQHKLAVQRYLAGEIPLSLRSGREVVGQRKDGTVFPMDIALSEVLVHGRRYFTGIMRDITARKQAEEEKRLRISQLARASRFNLVGEMAATVAHEINQPLAAISTYAQTCARQLGTYKEHGIDQIRDDLDKISTQAHRAAEIITWIRGVMKKSPAARKPQNINALIQEAMYLSDLGRSAAQVEIKFDLADALVEVAGDKIQLEQMILNLVRNGIESMVEGGTERPHLTIRTALDAQDQIEISISDNGPGIAPDMIEQIKTPFFSTKDDGMGMGLAITSSIIDAHHGTLNVESTPGHNTTFTVTLPTHNASSD